MCISYGWSCLHIVFWSVRLHLHQIQVYEKSAGLCVNCAPCWPQQGAQCVATSCLVSSPRSDWQHMTRTPVTKELSRAQLLAQLKMNGETPRFRCSVGFSAKASSVTFFPLSLLVTRESKCFHMSDLKHPQLWRSLKLGTLSATFPPLLCLYKRAEHKG